MEHDSKSTRREAHALSIAPMMDRTDRHYRYFMRLLTRHTLLYTEMVNVGAILHGDRDRHLHFSEIENPLALQLGGDGIEDLAACAEIGEEWGYDEVNLNVGCPSDRVKSGKFGACLMARPEVVAQAVNKMRTATSLPVTVKHRIGIDDLDKYEDLRKFVRIVAEAGCDGFQVHARIALLNGLSPADNRRIPPLRYEDVYRLAQEFPELRIEINGGIKTFAEIQEHLLHTDGVMIGREAYDHPFLFANADEVFFPDQPDGLRNVTRRSVLEGMIPYIEEEMSRGTRIQSMTRHILGLFRGCVGARQFKRYISERAHLPDSDSGLIKTLLEKMPAEALDEVAGATSKATL